MMVSRWAVGSRGISALLHGFCGRFGVPRRFGSFSPGPKVPNRLSSQRKENLARSKNLRIAKIKKEARKNSAAEREEEKMIMSRYQRELFYNGSFSSQLRLMELEDLADQLKNKSLDVGFEMVKVDDLSMLNDEQLEILARNNRITLENVNGKYVGRWKKSKTSNNEGNEVFDVNDPRYLQRFANVAVVGSPNAGKSTLVNCFTNSYISAVSPLPNTTERSLLGICTSEHFQIAFYDTPGISSTNFRNTTNKVYVDESWSTIQLADVVLVLVDASRKFSADDFLILKQLERLERKPGSLIALVLNKVDRVEPKEILKTLAIEINQKVLAFDQTFMISALEEDGTLDVLDYIQYYCTRPIPWVYRKDQVTTLSDKERVAEAIREAIFKRYSREIPYSVKVAVMEINENDQKSFKIQVALFVENERHKAIVIGQEGEGLEAIRKRSSKLIEQILDAESIDIQLFVLLRPSENNDDLEHIAKEMIKRESQSKTMDIMDMA